MLSKFASRLTRNDVRKFVSRNIGSTAIVLNKTDPIQQLFVDKVREYFKKKRYDLKMNNLNHTDSKIKSII